MTANPDLGAWDLGDAGTARVVERAYAGRCFDVYRLEAAGRSFALKVRAESPAADGPSYLAVRTLGGVSTVWNVACDAGHPVGETAGRREFDAEWQPADADALLADEAQRLRAAGSAWGHHEVRLSRGDLPARPDLLGLVTSWQPGRPLVTLERAERRHFLADALPALWDALAIALHGDLHGSNVMVTPDGAGFSLIDAGAQVQRHRGSTGPSSGADGLTFVTTAEAYPILPPYYCPDRPLAARGTLLEHWRSFVRSLTLSDQCPPFRAGANVVGHAVSTRSGRFLVRRAGPDGGPHPADLLALGILYYEALAGTHPFGGLAIPAWADLTSLDDRVEGSPFTAAWLAHGVMPPSRVDPAVAPAEDALALALLDLQVPTRERLVELAEAVRRG